MFGEMKVFSGSSHPELAVGIAAHIGMPLGKSRITRFSNENIKVKIEENVREADVFVIQSSCPPVSDNFMEMLILIDALKYASAARITAARAFTVLQSGGLMTPMTPEELPCQALADKGKPAVMAVLDDVVEDLIL